jgi:hypothetical protein
MCGCLRECGNPCVWHRHGARSVRNGSRGIQLSLIGPVSIVGRRVFLSASLDW